MLGAGVLLWIGTRSYGLYLYHWPIYQIIREVSGRPLSVVEFVAALAISAVVTEISFRIIETPIRRGTFRRGWRRLQRLRPVNVRRAFAGVSAMAVALVVVAGASLATAEVRPNEIEVAQREARRSVGDPFAAAAPIAARTVPRRAPRPTPTTTTTTTTTTTIAAAPSPVLVAVVATTTTTVPPTTTTTRPRHRLLRRRQIRASGHRSSGTRSVTP